MAAKFCMAVVGLTSTKNLFGMCDMTKVLHPVRRPVASLGMSLHRAMHAHYGHRSSATPACVTKVKLGFLKLLHPFVAVAVCLTHDTTDLFGDDQNRAVLCW